MNQTPSLLLLILFFLCSSLSQNVLWAQEYQKDWFTPPNQVQTFISPTGFGLKKGEGYYQ